MKITNDVHVFCVLVVVGTCEGRPVMVVRRVEKQLEIDVLHMVFQPLKIYCVGVFLVIYVTQVMLVQMEKKAEGAEEVEEVEEAEEDEDEDVEDENKKKKAKKKKEEEEA